MEQQKTETRSITAEQRKRVEEVCFRSLALIGRNCEYLEQHFDRTGADASTRQAVADIDTAAIQLDRTLSEAITLLEFLREDTKPQLYPIDLCELLQQVAAQSDMIRAQLGVDIRLDYGGCTACCVMADRRDAELLCLHLLSNALRASREGGSVCIALRRTESDWQLTVTDDGCGLPGEDAQAALENRRSFLGGAQLGLLLCRECCRRMDWSLQLEPAPEKGTQAVVCAFRCTRAKAAPMARWSCAPARRPSRSSASIICVPCWCGRCAPCRSAATRKTNFDKVARPLHSVLCGGLVILRPVLSCKRKAWYTEC